jgi:hypothetical protein
MNHLARICGVAILISFLPAAAFIAKVDNGEFTVVQKTGGARVVVRDSLNVNSGDSVFLAQEMQAAISLGNNSRLLLKGPLTLLLNGDNSSLKVYLDEGQVFLDHNAPYEIQNIQIISRGYTFQPIGTSAAVRSSRNTHPMAAVLKGKVKMQAPTGEAITVDEGNYGSVDQNGNLIFGKLQAKAIETLQAWSGVPTTDQSADVSPAQVATAPEQPQPASSPLEPAEQPQTALSITEEIAPAPTPSSQSQENQSTSEPVSPVKAAPEEPIAADVTTSPESDDSKGKEKNSAPVAIGNEAAVKSEKEKPAGGAATQAEKPQWEINAGTATVDNKQWTRIALGVDVPIWKFGVFFDVELFINDQGKFSDKGWNFKDDWVEAVTRKIRYIRFGHEDDPLFVKFGGLSGVTMGYGFVVDNFTNMLHYPDQKLLGLQVYLNDLTPLGITLQTLVADFKDFRDDGGVMAARLALTPLKGTGIPIIKGISIGGMYAVDLNQYAPARKWDFTLRGSQFDLDEDGIQDGTNIENLWQTAGDTLSIASRNRLVRAGKYDTLVEHNDMWASRETDQFGIIGADIGIPLIRSKLLNLDLYGQGGIRDDQKHGWGIGAPGVSLKVWKLWANVEYRHIEGRFEPGYFGTYYLDERLQRVPRILTKEALLSDDNLNGIFGRLGFNVANVLIVDGRYQYMIGEDKNNKDQRFEVTGSIGDLIVKKIPKLTKAEAYFSKSRIGSEAVGYDTLTGIIEYDKFFAKTPFMYYGYRVGIGIAAGASLILDTRFGFRRSGSDGFEMQPFNNITIQTAITF